MAKLSISVPDDLVDDLHDLATGNVSAFVTGAIRHEIDRRRLFAFLDELEDELGQVHEDEVGAFMATFSEVAAMPPVKRAPRPKRASRGRSSS